MIRLGYHYCQTIQRVYDQQHGIQLGNTSCVLLPLVVPHEGTERGVADEQTTVGCDGKIKVYDMSESTPLLLKIIEAVVASSESE